MAVRRRRSLHRLRAFGSPARSIFRWSGHRITSRWSGPQRRYDSLEAERRACAAAAAQRPYVMRRTLATLAPMLSLLLCAGGMYLWLWLPYRPWANPFFQPIGGIGGDYFHAFPNATGLRIHYTSATPQPLRNGTDRHLCGFWFQSMDTALGRTTVVVLPAWFLLLLTGLYPIVWIRNLLIALRQPNAGCCSNCGYDLRATPDRCPECGAVPQAPPQPAA